MRYLKYILPLVAVVILVACSRARVNHTSYLPLDSFYDQNKVEEQEFVITSEDTTGEIIGNQGTELIVAKRLFQDANGNEIDFPYSVKLVELYKYKDMIFYQMPNPHASGALNNGGEIRVRACKDNAELDLKSGSFFLANYSSTVTETDMVAFQAEVTSDEKLDKWNLASDGSNVVVDNDKYVLSAYSLGWSSPAKNNTSSKTDITFNIQGEGTENIDLAIAFKDFHCVLTGKNLKIEDVPVGESATVIAMAQDNNGNLRLHEQAVTTSSGMSIDLEMSSVSEAELMTVLDNL